MSTVGDSSSANSSGLLFTKIKANMDSFLEKINKCAAAINVLDADGSGDVSADELANALTNSAQWGAFDEVNLQVGQDIDKTEERAHQKGATVGASRGLQLRVNGSKIINESNIDGVDVSYTDFYNKNGDYSRTVQKVSKKTDSAEHTVEVVKYDTSSHIQETVKKGSQVYEHTVSDAGSHNVAYGGESVKLTKDGETIRFDAFEHKNAEGEVTWDGVKLFVDGKDVLADDN